MKRIAAFMLLPVLLLLTACSSYTYTLVHYENKDLLAKELSFEMEEIPNIDPPIAFAAADGRLGELTYAVVDELLGEGTLIFRMATPDYAEKYSSDNGVPGISPRAADSVLQTENIGSAAVTYYACGNAISAVWNLGGYAYSVSLSYKTEGAVLTRDSIYQYVLSVIAS